LLVDRKESGEPGAFAGLQSEAEVLAMVRAELGDESALVLAAELAKHDRDAERSGAEPRSSAIPRTRSMAQSRLCEVHSGEVPVTEAGSVGLNVEIARAAKAVRGRCDRRPSFRAIAAALAEQGHHAKGGNPFSPSVIKSMLKQKTPPLPPTS
jgi:hypothetical protein